MKKLKVLVAGDDLITNNLLLAILESEGHEATCVMNGIQALEKLNDDEMNLIISDGRMPLLDGFGLALRVKKDPKLKSIPFIMYTGTYASADDEKLARDYGITLYLRKAGSIKQISAAIRTLAAEIMT